MTRQGTFALAIAVPLGLAACADDRTAASQGSAEAGISGTSTTVPGLARAPGATTPMDTRTRRILALDVDGNGVIDLDEWTNGRQVAFVLIDYDDDGVIDQGEYLAATEARHDTASDDTPVMGSTGGSGTLGGTLGGMSMGGAAGTAGGTAGPQGEVVGRIDRPVQAPLGVDPDLRRRLDIFAALDRSGDGLLAQDEFVPGADRFFDTMDSSRDGMLQMDELDRRAGPDMTLLR